MLLQQNMDSFEFYYKKTQKHNWYDVKQSEVIDVVQEHCNQTPKVERPETPL